MGNNARQLEEEIKKAKIPILVEFWSSWCAPCQMVKSILEVIEQEYQNKLKVIKINTDLNFNLSSQYKIMGVPTFILFKNGQEVRREVGAKSKEELERLISETI